MRIGYVRFHSAVGSPGRAGNNITKAKLRTDETSVSTPRDELMDEIEVVEPFLVLRAVRLEGKRQVIRERYTPLSNCIDLEEAPPKPPTKNPKEGNPPT